MILEKFNSLQKSERLDIKRNISNLSNINKLRDAVRISVEKHHKKPTIEHDFPGYGLKLEQEILTDVITFIELILNKNDKSIIKNQKRENFIRDLCKSFKNKRINFSNGILEASKLLKIQNPPDYASLIYKNPEFLKDRIRLTELELFLNKGNFKWTAFDRSEFSDFLQNKKQSTLDPNANINCWEAMLYCLIRSEALKKDDVAKLYDPNLKLYESLEEISDAFRWETSKNIVDKNLFKNTCSYVPYFIEISNKGCEYLCGLHHDMISFPNSSAKILQTLLDLKYSNDSDNAMTVYSHWNKWTDSRIGNVPRQEILNLIDSKEVRIIPLNVFVKKFPKEIVKNEFDS
jgi:hypothetical protein